MNLLNYIYLIIFIILIYIYCYFIYPPNITIIQTTLQDFNFDMLLKKQPLVIEDNIKDILLLLKSWFSINIVQDIKFDETRIWNINYHKYLYFYCLKDTEILLYAAGNKKVINDTPDTNLPVISIKFKTNQGIILPYQWYYNIKNVNDIKLYGIHDYVTYVLDYFI